MTTIERLSTINLLKDYYQFLCGSWSQKAEDEIMQRLRDDIDRLEKMGTK